MLVRQLQTAWPDVEVVDLVIGGGVIIGSTVPTRLPGLWRCGRYPATALG